MTSARKTWRTRAIYSLKFLVAAGLISWLVASGRLKFADLMLFASDKGALLANTCVWLLGPILIAGLRWRVLLGALNLPIGIWSVLRLQLLATFFNLALPGALGGDGARFFYAPKGPEAGVRTRLLFSLLMDRVVGLCGLFFTAALGVSLAGRTLLANTALAPLVLFAWAGAAAIAAGLAVFWWVPLTWLRPQWQRLLTWLPWLSLGHQVVDALAAYRSKPWAILGGIAFSISTHALNILYLRYLAQLLTHQEVALSTLASMVPVATLIIAVPLVPGGLGIGHLVFEKLFLLAGLTSGANVYNLGALGQMAMGLCGLVPYLMGRRMSPATTEKYLQVHEPSEALRK